jgi:hypothetical protein
MMHLLDVLYFFNGFFRMDLVVFDWLFVVRFGNFYWLYVVSFSMMNSLGFDLIYNVDLAFSMFLVCVITDGILLFLRLVEVDVDVVIFMVDAWFCKRRSVLFLLVVSDSVLVIHINFSNNHNRLWLRNGRMHYFSDRNRHMLNLSFFDLGNGMSFYCCLELIASFGKMLVSPQDLLLFSLNLTGVFSFKIDTDLVVNE